ncbi:MAG: hypothetical protein AB7M12_11260 [Hyphomonadaceae bacterium]
MAALFPLLPAFVDLAGRAALLLRADASLAALGRRLLDCGAGVTFLDPDPAPQAEAMAPPARLLRRRWRATDFHAAALVVAGAGQRGLARARTAAKSAQALFLTVPLSETADFTLGDASAALGPVAFGLSAGALPAGLSASLAARLERAAPAHLAGFFEAAAQLGAALDEKLDARAARAFWQAALCEAAEGPAPPDWGAWLSARQPRAAR